MFYFTLMCLIILQAHYGVSDMDEILSHVFQGLQFCLQLVDRAINFRHLLVCLTEYRPSDLSNECKICLSAEREQRFIRSVSMSMLLFQKCKLPLFVK